MLVKGLMECAPFQQGQMLVNEATNLQDFRPHVLNMQSMLMHALQVPSVTFYNGEMSNSYILQYVHPVLSIVCFQ